jgi:hypothetical protein
MRLRCNNEIERGGVNAVRSLFESAGCVFQEIDLRNDYGKDAYVELGQAGEVTGLCVALQIKAGRKYKRADGYAMPVEKHEQYWRASTLPVAGIVHDPEDNSLHWVNITDYLRSSPISTTVIPIPTEQLLNVAGLQTGFWASMVATAARTKTGQAILSIVTENPDLQQDALWDSFAEGRSDPRVLVLIRHLLPMLKGDALRVAGRVLAFATSHPDIPWNNHNWIPEPGKKLIRRSFRWTEDEVFALILSAEYDEWRRGGAGQDAFHLLAEDPDIIVKVEAIVPRAFDHGMDSGATALAVALHFAEDQAPAVYERLVHLEPRVRQLGGVNEIEAYLREWGQISLFG